MFSAYSDYDFRNDQAVDMLEELFWENSYSSFNFFDYVTTGKDIAVGQQNSLKDIGLGNHFYSSVLGSEIGSKNVFTPTIKDISVTGEFYSNSIQLDDYTQAPSLVTPSNLALLPIYSELGDIEESFVNYKALAPFFSKFSTPTFIASGYGLGVRSYISVFNNFRSDFSDFN